MSKSIDKAPEGATYRCERNCGIDWYREDNGELKVWRHGGWLPSVYLSLSELKGRLVYAELIQAAKLTEIAPAPQAIAPAQPAEDDLTWLVRETEGEWPEGDNLIARSSFDVVLSSVCQMVPGCEWFTKEQYLARKAELQNKPSWDKAGSEYTHLVQTAYGSWAFTVDPEIRCGNVLSDSFDFLGPEGFKGEILGDWRDTLEQRPEPQSPVDMAMAIIGADSIEPEFKPVSVSNETVPLEQPVVVAGTSMPIAEWAEKNAAKQDDPSRSAGVIAEALRILSKHPDHLSANELSDLHDLCDAELTKRDERVYGGQKYLDATWYERGDLPPVGTVCQAKLWDRDWATMTIKGYHENTVWAGTSLCSLDKAKFRPCHPDHESLREVLEQQTLLPEEIGPLTDAILAAGFKREGGAA